MLVQLFCIYTVISTGIYSAVISISNEIINTTDDRFVSYTIDTGQLVNHLVNLSEPNLIYLTSQWPSYLRVGGTSADYVYYEIGSEKPCKLPTNESHSYFCLSMEYIEELIYFAVSTDSKLVFGLSLGYPTYPDASRTYWDSTNSVQFLQYLHDCGYNSESIYGFELGNEIAPDDPYSDPQIQSNAFKLLFSIINDIWGYSNNFKLFGPDPHSYILRDSNYTFSYIPKFVAETCSVLDGVTYHSYICINKSEILTPNGLDEQYTESVRVSNIWNEDIIQKQSAHCRGLIRNIWAGEIAEYNSGGQKHVTNTYYDGFWYLDAMGVLSNLGHAVFARQCLPSAAYSLLDANYEPNCDYYTALLFTQLMSNKVLRIESSDDNLRVYAHCAKSGNDSLSVAYINLNVENTVIQYDSFGATGNVYVWILTPANVDQGLQSESMALNGNVLVFQNGTLPIMKGKPIGIEDDGILVPALSYGFILFEGTDFSVC